MSHRPFGPVAIMGVGAGLTSDLRPGDLVVGTDVGAVGCGSAPLLAAELRRAGLSVRTGPITTVDHLVRRDERASLAAAGYLLADMESGPLAAAADGERPVAVVRAVSDTPDRPLAGIVSGGLAALRSLRAAAPVVQRWAAACGPRQVLLAGPRSFCAGVERAIEIVERALERQGEPVYVRKQIVHNTRVVGDLESRGACSSTSWTRCPTAPPWCSPRTACRPWCGRRRPGAGWRSSTRPARWCPRCTPRPGGSPPTGTRSR
jgi:4-hydroxy-3-methylbut-2-enyl diphosphate reductase